MTKEEKPWPKWYRLSHTAIWMLIGASAVITGYSHPLQDNLDFYTLFADDKEYKTANGEFACWYIDSIDISKLNELQSDIVSTYKKHCVDMPKP